MNTKEVRDVGNKIPPPKLKSPGSNFRASQCQNKAMLLLVFFIKNTAVHMNNENRIKDE